MMKGFQSKFATFSDERFGEEERERVDKPKNIVRALASSTTFWSVSAVVGGLLWLSGRYRVSRPNQFLVRTGPFISDIAINKKAFQLPFQTTSVLDMAPTNHAFNLHAMSSEMMEFILPGVFTIAPKDDPESLKKFALFLGGQKPDEINKIIEGIIEGETRVLAAKTPIKSIFDNRDVFKIDIINGVQTELDQFGLAVMNANVKELQDMPGSEYFKHMRQKARAGAENQARVETANAKFLGDVGEKQMQRDTRIQTANFEALAVQTENERAVQMAKSTAEYQIEKANYERQMAVAQIESQLSAEMRRAELQKDVEVKNIAQQTEKFRSEIFAKTIVEAEAQERRALANLFQSQQEAEAHLISKKKEAEGILAIFDAQSAGLAKLLHAHPDPMIALQYMMIDRDVYTRLGETNASAIKGLEPKINYWVTGDGAGSGNPIGQIFKNLPPLLDGVYSQTGIKPPAWLANTDELQKVMSKQ